MESTVSKFTLICCAAGILIKSVQYSPPVSAEVPCRNREEGLPVARLGRVLQVNHCQVLFRVPGPGGRPSGTLGHCYIALFWLYTTLAIQQQQNFYIARVLYPFCAIQQHAIQPFCDGRWYIATCYIASLLYSMHGIQHISYIAPQLYSNMLYSHSVMEGGIQQHAIQLPCYIACIEYSTSAIQHPWNISHQLYCTLAIQHP